MRDEVNVILNEALLFGASDAFGDLADELLELRGGWVEHGAATDAIEWLDELIAKAGWWSGRLAAGARNG